MAEIRQSPIAVIGAGAWGTALALSLARNNQSVNFWGRNSQNMQELRDTRSHSLLLPGCSLPENIQVCTELREALSGVKDVLLVVPSVAFRAVLVAITAVSPEIRLVWGTKGLDPETGLTLDNVVSDLLGEALPMAALSGPSFAREVIAGLPTAVTLASNCATFANDLVARFQSQYFHVSRSNDIIGVELCGVAKNVLAIGAGISDGMQLGANSRSALITQGFKELACLLEAVGGHKETLLSLAGFGDTLLTCTVDQSRNRRFGLKVGAGTSVQAAEKAIGQVIEGLANARQLYQLAQKHQVNMPIITAVYRVLYQGLCPRQAAQQLMQCDTSAGC